MDKNVINFSRKPQPLPRYINVKEQMLQEMQVMHHAAYREMIVQFIQMLASPAFVFTPECLENITADTTIHVHPKHKHESTLSALSFVVADDEVSYGEFLLCNPKYDT